MLYNELRIGYFFIIITEDNMDLLSKLKEVSASSEFVEVKDYYYHTHQCGGSDVKIRLDFVLSNDIDDSILRFGLCDKCGKCFYHKDFESRLF